MSWMLSSLFSATSTPYVVLMIAAEKVLTCHGEYRNVRRAKCALLTSECDRINSRVRSTACARTSWRTRVDVACGVQWPRGGSVAKERAYGVATIDRMESERYWTLARR